MRIKVLYRKIYTPKIVILCIICSLSIFLLGLLLAFVIAVNFGPRDYNLWDNYISDLGSFKFTPVPFILDLIAIITAILQIPIYSFFIKDFLLNQITNQFNSNNRILKITPISRLKKIAHIALFFLNLSIIGFFGIGIFSEDRTTVLELHLIFAILLFAGLTFGALFSGIIILLINTFIPRLLGLYMIFGPIVAGILFLFPPCGITRFLLEWIMFFAALIWLLPCLFIMVNQLKENKKNKKKIVI